MSRCGRVESRHRKRCTRALFEHAVWSPSRTRDGPRRSRHSRHHLAGGFGRHNFVLPTVSSIVLSEKNVGVIRVDAGTHPYAVPQRSADALLATLGPLEPHPAGAPFLGKGLGDLGPSDSPLEFVGPPGQLGCREDARFAAQIQFSNARPHLLQKSPNASNRKRGSGESVVEGRNELGPTAAERGVAARVEVDAVDATSVLTEPRAPTRRESAKCILQ